MKFDKYAYLWCFQSKKLGRFSNRNFFFNIYDDITTYLFKIFWNICSLSLPLSFSLHHSNKLGHFTSIGKTWRIKWYSPPLGRRSRNLKNQFPSSLMPTLVHTHTHPRVFVFMPSGVRECVFHTHSLTPSCMNTNTLRCVCVHTLGSIKL